jgi:hypothetical protein
MVFLSNFVSSSRFLVAATRVAGLSSIPITRWSGVVHHPGAHPMQNVAGTAQRSTVLTTGSFVTAVADVTEDGFAAESVLNFRAGRSTGWAVGAQSGKSHTLVLLPAWPCDVDVSFKLWAALNTSVELVWAGGAQVSLAVEPPERAAAVVFAPCNRTEAQLQLPIPSGMPGSGRRAGGGERRRE